MVLDGSIDLYSVMVETLFGSILMSGIVFGVFLTIVGIITKMSPMLIIMILGMFIAVFGTGYGGSLFAALVFIVALFYMIVGIMNIVNTRRYYG